MRDPRVRQALAGAGLATLYAGFYLAGTQYGLIGQGAAFVGLALVTAGAIALSFRFGLPSAVLGLVGGFAAPALVGGDSANLPLLALYLGLVTAGLSWTGERQQRPWLGLTALAGGLGWGALMLLTEDFGVSDILALGLYFVVLGAVLPTLVSASGLERPLRLIASALAAAQLAALVVQTVHDPLAWGLYLLLGATLAFFGWRKPVMREASGVAAVISVALLVLWDTPHPTLFAAVTAALTMIFAGIALIHVWLRQHPLVDIAMACALPLALGGAVLVQFGEFSADPVQPMLAAGFLSLAAFPALAVYRLWRSEEDLIGLFAALGTGALLALGAILLVTPGWMAPLAASAILAALIGLTRRHGAAPLADLPWLAWIVALVTLIATPRFIDELFLLFGEGNQSAWLRALLRWGSLAAVTAFLASGQTQAMRRAGAAMLAGLAGYGAIAQIVPAPYLGLTTAILATAIHTRLSAYGGAGWAMLGVSLAWAAHPLALWLAEGAQSLGGYPVLRNNIPSLANALLRIVPPAAALAFMSPSITLPCKDGKAAGQTEAGRWFAAGMAIAALHIVFKQGFDIATLTRFEALGTAERTAWQILLLACAAAIWRGLPVLGSKRPLTAIFAAAALAHFALYSLGLHNPLWDRQAVGPTPIANLASLSNIVGMAAAIMLRRLAPERAQPALDGVVMAIASFGALAVLRQLFAGSILVDAPLGQTEDLLRSLIGILLALVFLFIGSRTGHRSWRIGSLVLMLVAVVKVFVFDTAGLEGLLRIASFLALGLSLLGLGWFYSRILGGAPKDAA